MDPTELYYFSITLFNYKRYFPFFVHGNYKVSYAVLCQRDDIVFYYALN